MSEVKTYTWDELKAPEAADKKGILMLINGKVYAISKFLDEVSPPSQARSGWVERELIWSSEQHPGGDEVLLGEAGRDATEAFEDVGHSDEARALLDQYFVGNGPEVSRRSLFVAAGWTGSSRWRSDDSEGCSAAACVKAAEELVACWLEARWRLFAGWQSWRLRSAGAKSITLNLLLFCILQGPAKAEPKRQRGAGVEHGQSQCVVISLSGHTTRKLISLNCRSYTYLYPLAGLVGYIAWK